MFVSVILICLQELRIGRNLRDELQNIQIIQNIQNIHYGKLMYNKIQFTSLFSFSTILDAWEYVLYFWCIL